MVYYALTYTNYIIIFISTCFIFISMVRVIAVLENDESDKLLSSLGRSCSLSVEKDEKAKLDQD